MIKLLVLIAAASLVLGAVFVILGLALRAILSVLSEIIGWLPYLRVILKVSPAVVHIRVFNGQSKNQATGSGFIIDARGYIITCEHVVAQGQKFFVRLPTGRTHEARLIASDFNKDIALLKIETEEKLPVLLSAGSDVAEMGDVLIVGRPAGLFLRVVHGFVIVGGFFPSLGRPACKRFLITAFPRFGHSGAPMVNFNGQVVGMVRALRDIDGNKTGEAVAVSEIKAFFHKAGKEKK